jgi:hypothetical protein
MDELIDLIEPNVNSIFKVKEGESVVDLECRNKRALIIINLFVNNEIVPHIVGILDLAIMWQTLKNLFEQQNRVRSQHLRTKLTNF